MNTLTIIIIVLAFVALIIRNIYLRMKYNELESEFNAALDDVELSAQEIHELRKRIAATEIRVQYQPREEETWIYNAIRNERKLQDAKYGVQSYPLTFDKLNKVPRLISLYYNTPKSVDAKGACRSAVMKNECTWADILIEEVAEALEAETLEQERDELIQVAAVCVAAVQDIETKIINQQKS